MDVIPMCTCVGYPSQASPNPDTCHLCGDPTRNLPDPLPAMPFLFSFMDSSAVDFEAGDRVLDGVPRLIATVISGALTGLFALAGAFTGAITGAVAARAADCGVLRGAGLGAIAGAVLSVEVLEASRAYWDLEQSGSRGPSSMADFLEELLRGRLIDDQLGPALLSAYSWQVRVTNMTTNESHDIYGEVASGGLSGDSLKKLPCHMLDEIKESQPICCTICLQDIEVGEIARTLPRCDHTFHLTCVDKWLVRHGSCPICRQDV